MSAHHSQHSLHGHRHVPMVGGMTRGQFSKFVFPSALLIILFIAYSILVDIYSLNLDTKELPTDAVLFCIVWSLLLSSFLRGAFTSPGLVETGWYKRYPEMYKILKQRWKLQKEQMQQQQQWMKRFNKNDENDENDDDENTKLLINEEDEDEIEFPENFARPPRSHYCHELGGNILRMDHFCVWFNNAVGFKNYKFFLLTLIYLNVSCLISLYIIIYRIFINHISNDHNIYLRAICLILSFVICIFFVIFSSMHLYLHLWQLTKNLTSIEYHKVMQLKAMAHHFQISFASTHEFDDGIYLNCKKMLGNDIIFWWLPLAPSLPEDGIKFSVNQENKQKIQNLTKQIQLKREELWKKSKLIKK